MRKTNRGVLIAVFLFLLVGILAWTKVQIAQEDLPEDDPETAAVSEALPEESVSPEVPGEAADPVEPDPETLPEPLPEPEPEPEPDPVAEYMAGMSREEKVYQMIFAAPEMLTGDAVVTAADERFAEIFRQYPVGGIILFQPNIENRQQVTELIRGLQS